MDRAWKSTQAFLIQKWVRVLQSVTHPHWSNCLSVHPVWTWIENVFCNPKRNFRKVWNILYGLHPPITVHVLFMLATCNSTCDCRSPSDLHIIGVKYHLDRDGESVRRHHHRINTSFFHPRNHYIFGNILFSITACSRFRSSPWPSWTFWLKQPATPKLIKAAHGKVSM